MSDQKDFEHAYLFDKFVRLEDAKVSIMTNALQYGTGVFGGIRGYLNEEKGFINVFRLEDHYARFLNSLRILGVELPYTKEELVSITLELLEKNQPSTDIYFRPFAFAGSLGLSPNLAKDHTFDFSLYMIPLADYLPTNKGLKAKVSSFRRINDEAIPSRTKASGGYINSALARKEAADNGYDEAIFLNKHGHVCEGSAENIFMVRDGKLITPSVSDDILEGITRRSIMSIAEAEGIEVVERSIDRSEMYIAEEMFFSGTGAQVAWISQIDGRTIGTGKKGEVSSIISEKFFEAVRGNNDNYSDWCTKVETKWIK